MYTGPKGRDWVTSFLKGFYLLATLKLSGETYRVLFVMLSKMTFNNFIFIRQKDIAEILGIGRQQVSRAIKALLAAEVLFIHDTDGRYVNYIFNPDIAFRGAHSKIGKVKGMVNDIRNKEAAHEA